MSTVVGKDRIRRLERRRAALVRELRRVNELLRQPDSRPAHDDAAGDGWDFDPRDAGDHHA